MLPSCVCVHHQCVFGSAGERVCLCLLFSLGTFHWGSNQYVDRCEAGGGGSHSGVDQLRAVCFQDCRKWCVSVCVCVWSLACIKAAPRLSWLLLQSAGDSSCCFPAKAITFHSLISQLSSKTCSFFSITDASYPLLQPLMRDKLLVFL